MKKINLFIPKPCHENWDQMTQVEKGKFCSSCQKTVVDFTNMNDRQLAEFFKKPNGSTCGRFYADQLNRDIAIPGKRIPWIRYLFQFSLPAFLVSVKSYAQSDFITGDTVTVSNQLQGKTVSSNLNTKKHFNEIKGKIVNEKGEPIGFATVNQQNTSITSVADENGNFSIEVSKNENQVLIVTAIGYNPVTNQIGNGKEVIISMETVSVQMLPVIVLSSDLQGRTCRLGGFVSVASVPKGPITLIKKAIDTAFKKFSVYPNPVRRNSNTKIDLKKLEQGQYTIAIISMSGEVVQTEEIVVENKNQVVDLHLNETTAGTYLVHVFNRKTAASYSEKIIVE